MNRGKGVERKKKKILSLICFSLPVLPQWETKCDSPHVVFYLFCFISWYPTRAPWSHYRHLLMPHISVSCLNLNCAWKCVFVLASAFEHLFLPPSHLPFIEERWMLRKCCETIRRGHMIPSWRSALPCSDKDIDVPHKGSTHVISYKNRLTRTHMS